MPKQTKEERLLKKRMAERRRKAKIKSNPEQAETLRKSDRERYHQKKREGKLVSQQPMSQRTRRALQRKNKAYQQEYYQRRKATKRVAKETESNVSSQHVLCNSNFQQDIVPNCRVVDAHEPLATSTTRFSRFDNESTHQHTSDTRTLRPRTCRDCNSPDTRTRTCNQTILQRQYSNSLQPSTSRANPQPSKSRNFRTSSPVELTALSPPTSPCVSSIDISTVPLVCPDSPTSDTSITSVDLKRDFKNKFRRYQKSKTKEIELLQRRISELKRENITYKKQVQRLGNVSKILKTKESKEIVVLPKQNITKHQNEKIQNDVIEFYEDDENSRLCPGKKDTITRHKIKKQKRYLSSSLKVLHNKYLSSGLTPISYTSFCRMKPFWVVKPKLSNRNTCMCVIHENMELLTTALKINKIISENTTTDLLQSLCCDKNNVNCLSRKCSGCQNKIILYREFDNSNSIIYWKWGKTTRDYVQNNVEKSCIVTAKIRLVEKPLEVIKIFENHLERFLRHCANIRNQAEAVNKIKHNLDYSECLVHIDYSENYSTKYGSEIQSVHFGGSRQQLTLHTGVIYYRCSQDHTLKSQAFCTISSSLRHDASAVWAHMVPILSEIDKILPEISTLHIISDSPSAQYRNKKIFYIMSQFCSYCPNLTCVAWHYCECGHGKGAPDGVGGVLKRTADQLVAYGNDITDIDSLIQSLKANTKSIKIERVEDYEITEKDWLIPSQLRPFPGTMKVHEVIWTKYFKHHLALRSLSCTKPQCMYNSTECLHGKHLGFYDLPSYEYADGEIQRTIREEGLAQAQTMVKLTTNIVRHSVNIQPPVQDIHIISQQTILDGQHPVTVHRFKGSEKMEFGNLQRRNTSKLLTGTSRSQHQHSKLQSKTFLSKYTNQIGTDLDEAAVPSQSFFENINSDLLSKFEKSGGSAATAESTLDVANSSDSDLNIF